MERSDGVPHDTFIRSWQGASALTQLRRQLSHRTKYYLCVLKLPNAATGGRPGAP